MSLIPHSVFPRSLFDWNQWNLAPFQGLSTMDVFDPFDEIDHMIGRNLEWLNKPAFLRELPQVPRVPHKFRITVDVHGYKPSSIKIEWLNDRLVVSGREEDKIEGTGDFTVREFKRSYDVPANAEREHLVSFITTDGHLVIEFPLKETVEDMFPKIVENKDGTKAVSLKFNLPQGVDPSKAHINIKDRDLVMRIENKVDRPDRHSKVFFYKRTTLPENTDFDRLVCNLENNQIVASAPLLHDITRHHSRSIPLHTKHAIQGHQPHTHHTQHSLPAKH